MKLKFESMDKITGAISLRVELPIYPHRSRKRMRHIRRQNFRKLFKMPPPFQKIEVVRDETTGLDIMQGIDATGRLCMIDILSPGLSPGSAIGLNRLLKSS